MRIGLGLALGGGGLAAAATFNGNLAQFFPGAYQIIQTDLGSAYSATCAPTTGNTSTTAVSLSGTASGVLVPVMAKATSSASIGAGATFSIYYDGGTTPAMTGVTPTAGVPVALTGAGSGISLSWSAGTSVTNDSWKAAWATLADQSGNGKTYTQATATKQLIVSPGLNGRVGAQSDGVRFAVSTVGWGAPSAGSPIYTTMIFRQLSWVITKSLATFHTSGRQLITVTSAPTIQIYDGTGLANSGAAVGTWVELERTSTNTASDPFKVGTTITTGASGNLATVGMEIGAGNGGVNGAAIELLFLAYTPVLPDWAGFRSALVSAYGNGNVLA